MPLNVFVPSCVSHPQFLLPLQFDIRSNLKFSIEIALTSRVYQCFYFLHFFLYQHFSLFQENGFALTLNDPSEENETQQTKRKS